MKERIGLDATGCNIEEHKLSFIEHGQSRFWKEKNDGNQRSSRICEMKL